MRNARGRVLIKAHHPDPASIGVRDDGVGWSDAESAEAEQRGAPGLHEGSGELGGGDERERPDSEQEPLHPETSG